MDSIEKSEQANEATRPAMPQVPAGREKDLADAIKEATAMPAFKLIVDKETTPSLTGSKLAGLPYWPHDLPFPEPEHKGLSSDEHLALLAQIDLADLGGDPRLPDHGLLQFFVTTDDLSGLEFDVPMDTQRHFKVVWHETVDPAITEQDVASLGILAATTDDIFPVYGEHALKIEPTTSCINPCDVRFDKAFQDACIKVFGDEFARDDLLWTDCFADDQYNLFFDLIGASEMPQHLIFGYPGFTQWDPRDEKAVEDYDTLLLQLDSDCENPSIVMWGDSGVGNFFINSNAAARGDFSRVLYNWDCY